MSGTVKRTLFVVVSSLVVAFALMQLVPYRVSNAATRQEPSWDSPRTRELAVRACYDCHSNEVKTPWYGKVAPVSWWITNHVKEGRSALNFSEWRGSRGEASHEAAESVSEGSMPPASYTWLGLHSNAKLTPRERQELVDGLKASLGK